MAPSIVQVRWRVAKSLVAQMGPGVSKWDVHCSNPSTPNYKIIKKEGMLEGETVGSRYAGCMCDLLIKKYYLRPNMILLMTYSSFLWHIVLFEGLLGYSSFFYCFFLNQKRKEKKNVSTAQVVIMYHMWLWFSWGESLSKICVVQRVCVHLLSWLETEESFTVMQWGQSCLEKGDIDKPILHLPRGEAEPLICCMEQWPLGIKSKQNYNQNMLVQYTLCSGFDGLMCS